MWDWFIDFLASILAGLEGLCGDWGVAIIILTLIIRVIIMPLMTKSTASSAKMQALQPKMMEIQERYQNDPEKQAAELQKFYAENKFNPLGGCLPILLQMPVFFALFTVTKSKIPEGATLLGGIMLGASPSSMMSAGGFAAAWPYVLFDVLFGVLTFIPMVLQMKNSTNPEQSRQSVMMGAVMSVFMLWFGWTINAGVLLYYVTSSIWQVVQQQVVTNRVMEKVKAETEEKLKNKPVEVDVVRKERKPRPHKKS
ncbi:MAG: YidC/Oxa1 family membrane protein insertase [Coriobacteriales bacterium]|nr:YidC/Oxa1 family membrane protein insertase [Coriobacteriales bacterium]